MDEKQDWAECFALVTRFGKWRRCKVRAYGEPLEQYTPAQTLWIELGEDWYGLRHYREPFCVLTRESWLQSELDELTAAICERGQRAAERFEGGFP